MKTIRDSVIKNINFKSKKKIAKEIGKRNFSFSKINVEKYLIHKPSFQKVDFDITNLNEFMYIKCKKCIILFCDGICVCDK